jgi:YVTN family beta-propeller protein
LLYILLAGIQLVPTAQAQGSQSTQRKAYVYNADNKISVLESNNNSVVVTQTIPVNGSFVTNVVSNSAGTRMYAGGTVDANNPSLDVLWVLNTTNNMLTSVPLPALPYYLAINPAGTRIYMLSLSSASQEPARVFVIDTTNYGVIATIPVSPVGTSTLTNGPLAVNPSGTRVYVNVSYIDPLCPCRDTDPLCPCGVVFSLIDTASNSVVDYIRNDNFSLSANQLVFSPNGALMYALVGSQIKVIGIPSHTLVKDLTIGQGNGAMVINSTGTRIYAVSSGSNSVSAVDPTSNAVQAVSVGVNPLGIAISSNGNRVYVTNNFGNSVSVIDLNTNSLVTTVGVGQSPTSITIP